MRSVRGLVGTEPSPLVWLKELLVHNLVGAKGTLAGGRRRRCWRRTCLLTAIGMGCNWCIGVSNVYTCPAIGPRGSPNYPWSFAALLHRWTTRSVILLLGMVGLSTSSTRIVNWLHHRPWC